MIQGDFIQVDMLSDGNMIPEAQGIYCIKLREGVSLPPKYAEVRKDSIIYIGIATSLKNRLWEQELNHKQPATFFRSIGAILGYLPPKGSLAGRHTRNYKFSTKDTDAIKSWMQQSLLVNFVQVDQIVDIEKQLIQQYQPLVNIKHNPTPSAELKSARKKCVEYAKTTK